MTSDLMILILLACVCGLLVTTIIFMFEIYKLEDRIDKLHKDNNRLKRQVEMLTKMRL